MVRWVFNWVRWYEWKTPSLYTCSWFVFSRRSIVKCPLTKGFILYSCFQRIFQDIFSFSVITNHLCFFCWCLSGKTDFHSSPNSSSTSSCRRLTVGGKEPRTNQLCAIQLQNVTEMWSNYLWIFGNRMQHMMREANKNLTRSWSFFERLLVNTHVFLSCLRLRKTRCVNSFCISVWLVLD